MSSAISARRWRKISPGRDLNAELSGVPVMQLEIRNAVEARDLLALGVCQTPDRSIFGGDRRPGKGLRHSTPTTNSAICGMSVPTPLRHLGRTRTGLSQQPN